MCAEADKKVFWIREEETEPFIQVDGEDFFTAEEIRETFGLSRTVFFNQLSEERKLTSWILRRNLMKSLGNRPDWRNF